MSKIINDLIPGVKNAPENYSAINRILWSILALVMYFIMSSTPVYILGGFQFYGDSFNIDRIIEVGSERTLMALGILPLIVGWLLVYLVRHGQLKTESPIEYQTNLNLYKVLTLISTLFMAIGLIIGRNFGQALSTEAIMLIVFQLILSTGVLLYLDEMIRKGWGYGNAIILIFAGNAAAQLFWQVFSFEPAIHAGLNEPLGVITAFSTILLDNGPLDAIGAMLLRPHLPTNSFLAMLFTGVIFMAVMHWYNNNSNNTTATPGVEKGTGIESDNQFSLDLIHNSNVASILIVFSILALISMMATILFNTLGDNNIVVTLLGTYATTPNGQVVPVGGLAKFFTPPRGLYGAGALIPLDSSLIFDTLLRTIVYIVIVLLLTSIVDTKLTGNNYGQNSFFDRPAIRLVLLAVLAEILGVPGSGIGVVLMIVIFYQILQEHRNNYVVDVDVGSKIPHVKEPPIKPSAKSLISLILVVGLLGFLLKVLADTLFGPLS